jgi:glutamyl-tRNA synthetase
MRTSRANHALSGWICGSCKNRFQASRSQRRTNSTSTRKARLPDTPARTRFAPSPTGNLHLGSIRTALFNYLLARRTKGQFLLRIEDTDQKRTIPGAEERLFEDLQWAGLQWDEGPLVGGPYGPYRQSERTQLYQEHVKPLLQNGKAYRCFCSAERIKSFNEARHAEGLPLGYDRKCTHIPLEEAEDRVHNGESHVIRFLVPKEYPRYHDLVYGKSGHGSNKTKKLLLESPVYDDPILLKSDGFPTYHFANIVDDHLMKITHVVRGSEWMTSTPLHIALYEAFAWVPPEYAHVPLLVDKTGAKLSKRNADTDIASFRACGIFPEALTNFTALLGWSHQGKNDVMDLAELSETFDLKITKGNTIVSFEKLAFLQERHALRRISAGGAPLDQIVRDVAVALLERYGAAKVMAFLGPRRLEDVIRCMLQSTRSGWVNATTFAEWAGIFLKDLPRLTVSEDVSTAAEIRTAASTLLLTPAAQWTTRTNRANLESLEFGPDPSKSPPLEPETDPLVISKANKKAKSALYHWLRWALLNGAAGPGIPDTMEILGRDICVQRIQAAVLLCRDAATARDRPAVSVRVAKGTVAKDGQQVEWTEYKTESKL